jgi:hypothetical protein
VRDAGAIGFGIHPDRRSTMLKLVPLCTAEATLAPPITLAGSPAGSRVIFEVRDALLTGERLRARMHGAAAADWLVIGADGTAMLDVRLTVETHDGALILVQYNGRTDVSGGSDDARPIYVAPRFETGDERYRWLNNVQAVGRGERDGDRVRYEWFEVR